MTGDEIVALSKKHTITEYAAQDAVNPIPVARAKGVYFWTPEGKRFIDFNSQLMSVNIGHGDPRVIKAITEQAEKVTYVTPSMTTEARARLGAKLAEITPGDIDAFFFTNGGAEANENAFKIARAVTGRQKILARYRSYHGGTAAAIAATGDPRGWSQPPMPGIVHVLDPYHGVARGWDDAATSLRYLEEVIQLEGPQTIAAFILETVTGTNGILVPPDGYLQGVRALCDKHGILMIADEVMAGFGRTGEWFAIEHWNVVPDMITMAKGLTSSYVQLGAVGVRRHIADHFKDKMFPGGLTYSSHPRRLRRGAGDDRRLRRGRPDRAGAADRRRCWRRCTPTWRRGTRRSAPSRSIGLFGIIELVRNRQTREPMAPLNGTSPEMAALGKFFREEGLFTFVRWNYFFTNPPLCITEAGAARGDRDHRPRPGDHRQGRELKPVMCRSRRAGVRQRLHMHL